MKVFLLTLLSFASLIFAQTPVPAPAPTTAPARKPFVDPPGFHRITVDGRTVVCETADDAWVKQALTNPAPATKPATNPVDIIEHLNTNRAILKAHVSNDLALKDIKIVDQLIDEKLIPAAKKLADFNPPLVYFVATHDRLKELLKSGWQDRRFYYNRAADEVAYNPELRLSEDGGMDDLIMPFIYASTLPADRRAPEFSAQITRTDSAMMDALAGRAQQATHFAIIDFIHQQIFDAMKLSKDQQWFSLGIEAVLSAKYMHDAIGMNHDHILAAMVSENPRNPIRANTIDLLHPTDPAELRPAYVPAYQSAYRARSARVVYIWINRAGEGAIGVTVAAMRASPPADGAALVKLINTATGVDLSNEVRPR